MLFLSIKKTSVTTTVRQLPRRMHMCDVEPVRRESGTYQIVYLCSRWCLIIHRNEENQSQLSCRCDAYTPHARNSGEMCPPSWQPTHISRLAGINAPATTRCPVLAGEIQMYSNFVRYARPVFHNRLVRVEREHEDHVPQ